MATKFKTNTNSFTFAHYILLFLVTIICISIISWVVIKRNNPTPQNNITPTIVHIKSVDPCVQRITNAVAQMWAYNPRMVPQKYWQIASDYLDEVITTRTYGICQDVAFTCRPGQKRIECDPCAVPSARAFAQDRQTADTISENCPNTN